MAFREFLVPVGEIELAVRENGPEDAPAVLLLHGLGGVPDTWDPFAVELAGRGRRAVAVALRGHGDSSWPGTGYDFGTMAEDVAGLIEKVGVAPADVVGHSLGGRVALALAAARPELVRRMVLAEAPPARHVAVPAETPQRPAEPTPFDWAVVPAIRPQARAVDPAWWAVLPSITVPALWVAGGPTSQVPQELIAEAAALMPSAELVTLEGAGHHVHTVDRAAFSAVVLPYLEG